MRPEGRQLVTVHERESKGPTNPDRGNPGRESASTVSVKRGGEEEFPYEGRGKLLQVRKESTLVPEGKTSSSPGKKGKKKGPLRLSV